MTQGTLRRVAARCARRVRDYIPNGLGLSSESWRVRHRALSYLLSAHVPGVIALGVMLGRGVAHSLAEASTVGLFVVAAGLTSRNRSVSAAVTALGLVTSSAVLVHVSGGMIEMHFHFFVMVGILTLYQDWWPFLAAVGFVVVHHGVLGVLAPTSVYNHPAAIAHPLRWAFVHGAFVLAASAASVIAWRLNEENGLKDPLTRLANRRLFHDRVSHALARTERCGVGVAVLYLDFDGFKLVNDTLGHAGGDELLALAADRLRTVIRPCDTAARLGGDEFALLIEDITAEAEARRIAERLVAALAPPFVIRGIDVAVSASIGIALSGPGLSADGILSAADSAMYQAKAVGSRQADTARVRGPVDSARHVARAVGQRGNT